MANLLKGKQAVAVVGVSLGSDALARAVRCVVGAVGLAGAAWVGESLPTSPPMRAAWVPEASFEARAIGTPDNVWGTPVADIHRAMGGELQWVAVLVVWRGESPVELSTVRTAGAILAGWSAVGAGSSEVLRLRSTREATAYYQEEEAARFLAGNVPSSRVEPLASLVTSAGELAVSLPLAVSGAVSAVASVARSGVLPWLAAGLGLGWLWLRTRGRVAR